MQYGFDLKQQRLFCKTMAGKDAKGVIGVNNVSIISKYDEPQTLEAQCFCS